VRYVFDYLAGSGRAHLGAGLGCTNNIIAGLCRIRRPSRFADGGARRIAILGRLEPTGWRGLREGRLYFGRHFSWGPRLSAILGSLAIYAPARVRWCRSRALSTRARAARSVCGGFDAGSGDPRESPVCMLRA